MPDGQTCAFTKCDKGSCASPGLNVPGVCAECRYVSLDNPSSPAIPKPRTCFGMSTTKTDSKGNITSAISCNYQKGGVTQTSSGNSIIGGLDNDSCFETVIDCSNVKNCESYDDLPIYYFDDSTLKTDKVNAVLPIELGTICSTDPCNVAKNSNYIAKCKWDGDRDCDNVCKPDHTFCSN